MGGVGGVGVGKAVSRTASAVKNRNITNKNIKNKNIKNKNITNKNITNKNLLFPLRPLPLCSSTFSEIFSSIFIESVQSKITIKNIVKIIKLFNRSSPIWKNKNKCLLCLFVRYDIIWNKWFYIKKVFYFNF